MTGTSRLSFRKVSREIRSIALDKKATLSEKMLPRKKGLRARKKESLADCCHDREILPFIASHSHHCRADTWKELYSRSLFNLLMGQFPSKRRMTRPISISVPFSGCLRPSGPTTPSTSISISHLWSMSYFM